MPKLKILNICTRIKFNFENFPIRMTKFVQYKVLPDLDRYSALSSIHISYKPSCIPMIAPWHRLSTISCQKNIPVKKTLISGYLNKNLYFSVIQKTVLNVAINLQFVM